VTGWFAAWSHKEGYATSSPVSRPIAIGDQTLAGIPSRHFPGHTGQLSLVTGEDGKGEQGRGGHLVFRRLKQLGGC